MKPLNRELLLTGSHPEPVHVKVYPNVVLTGLTSLSGIKSPINLHLRVNVNSERCFIRRVNGNESSHCCLVFNKQFPRGAPEFHLRL